MSQPIDFNNKAQTTRSNVLDQKKLIKKALVKCIGLKGNKISIKKNKPMTYHPTINSARERGETNRQFDF